MCRWPLAQYDPELSVLLATCWVHANQPRAGDSDARRAEAAPAAGEGPAVDRGSAALRSDDKALAWLEEIVGGGRDSRSTATATQWVMFRGNENAQRRHRSGGVPLLNFNWKLPTVNDPQDEDEVKQLLARLRDRGEPLISALAAAGRAGLCHRPPAGEQQAGRHQPARRASRNGSFRRSMKPAGAGRPAGAADAAARRSPNVREQELKQRIWEDHAFGQVSSDGRQVYVIDELGFAPMINVSARRCSSAAGGRRDSQHRLWPSRTTCSSRST